LTRVRVSKGYNGAANHTRGEAMAEAGPSKSVESPPGAETRVEQIVLGTDLGWVAGVLAERRDEILDGWLETTAAQPFHAGRRERAVADHIPHLLDALIALLQRAAPRWVAAGAPLDDPAVLEAAREHARVRFEQGLQATDVVTEFRLLRQEIGRVLRAHLDDRVPTGDVVGAELLVHDAIDGAITLGLSALTTHVEEVREDFLATTIHDTRQPITAAKGRIQLAIHALERPDRDPVQVREALRQADADLDRMAEMLATLAEVSRLTLGRLTLAILATDLVEVVGEGVRSLPPGAAERVRVAVAPGSDTRGDWDPRMLCRVLANLLSNAAKYSPPETPIEVTVSSDPETDTVAVGVRDYGIGLAADEITGLFRRYGRARGAVDRGVQGLGLGLYLSHGIVEAHGGRIWTESAGPGKGTTMHVRLPRSVPPPPGEQAPPSASALAPRS
jgi:signal transduction histidine kinase